MNWPVIILDGPARNQTLSSILFDKFGTFTDQEVFICDNWIDGFDWAQQKDYDHALFVKSGSMFLDWPQWKKLVDNYPHHGMIAHLIWYPGQRVHIDDQCWFMNVKKFDRGDFFAPTVIHPVPARSDQNLHDDYTPLWIKPTLEVEEYAVTDFGQGLVARQLQKNQPVVNWNRQARDLKFFLYNNHLDLSIFQDYKNIAENQLWIFNNEPITVIKQPRLVSPGSGLSWMLNIIDESTHHIQIVDISQTQIKFCQQLWNHWDGSCYGDFVWNFIEQNQLIHYELDTPNLSALERLQLKGRSRFVKYVDDKFAWLTGDNFQSRWLQTQSKKTVDFHVGNLVTWVLENDTSTFDHVWCSNILKYKWTMLHTTVEQYSNFTAKINETKNQ